MESKRTVDHNGFWQIEDNPISKVGVFPYAEASVIKGGDPRKVVYVLRPAESLSNPDCINSFKLMPLVNEHPESMLGIIAAESHGVEGAIGENVWFDGEKLLGNLKIYSESFKDFIESGKVQLSAGYYCDFEARSGVFNGQAYEYVQTNILANHVALVQEGRCGKDVQILDRMQIFDSVDINITNVEYINNMNTKKTALDNSADNLAKLGQAISEFANGENQEPEHQQDNQLDNVITNDNYEPETSRFDRIEEQLKMLAEQLAKLIAHEASEPESSANLIGDNADNGDDNENAIGDENTTENNGENELPKKISEDEEKAHSMDSIKKEVMRDIRLREQVYNTVSNLIGAFKADAMDSALDVAKYGVRKLKLQCKDGEEISVLNAFAQAKKMAAASAAKTLKPVSVANDSAVNTAENSAADYSKLFYGA